MEGRLLPFARWLTRARFSHLDMIFLLAFLAVQLHTRSFFAALPVLLIGALASGLVTVAVRRVERRRGADGAGS